jgi:hypothetical protein
MSDDRELIERLAAIDATPRAGWVAALRADLDSAWETDDPCYHLESRRTTTVTLVEKEPAPSEPSSGRRWAILIAAAAAIVLLVAVVVIRDVDDGAPADQPSPTVTVPPTTPPRALFGSPQGEALVQGTYFVDEVDGIPTPRIFVTIGDGWWKLTNVQGLVKQWPNANRPRRDVGFIHFSRPDRVFSDACHWHGGYYSRPVTTLNALVAALSKQRGWVDVTAPSDISVDGYPGKTFQRTAPAPAVLSDCPTMVFGARSWPEPGAGTWPAFRSWDSESNIGGFVYEPGETETLVVLDIDGTVVVINTRMIAGSSAAERAEFAAVLDSIRIDRG